MSQQDADLGIDYDAELAKIQSVASGVSEPEHPAEAVKVISGAVVDSRRTVEFMGEKFRIADKIGAMPLLKFSMYADMSVQDPKALAAMYAMLRDCIYPGRPGCGTCGKCAPPRCGQCRACEIAAGLDDETPEDDKPACRVNTPDEKACKDYDPGDWQRFEEHAMATKAEADDLFDVITATMEVLAGRPTKQSSGSSRGPRGISGGSTARSSGRRAKGSKR
jgi:hypothetical protein